MSNDPTVSHWNEQHWHGWHWDGDHWVIVHHPGGGIIEAMQGWAPGAEAMQGFTGVEAAQGFVGVEAMQGA